MKPSKTKPVHQPDYLRSLGFRRTLNGFASAIEDLTAAIQEKLAGLAKAAPKNDKTPLCPADRRIQDFLNDILSGAEPSETISLPSHSFVLDRHGLARQMSLPQNKDMYSSKLLQSYRVKQGILHNPRNDRRTTQGVFHIAECGLPIPNDKLAVPVSVFKKLLIEALRPPQDLLQVPFTAGSKHEVKAFISLLLRPVVSPDVPGYSPEKSMEIRFFAPASLASNLDFVESIFGNAGDPYLPENDAALDVEHWTGHTGCVILAPHLTGFTKKDLGLPHWDDATQRQRRDGMCWKDAAEFYNGGEAFKITCRDARGVIVTLIADNYFGYCKKEVKTQISFSANLFGNCEEEHSGGAVAFASYDLGQEFDLHRNYSKSDFTFDHMAALLGDAIEVKPQGYAVDRRYPDIVYVPENAAFNMRAGRISWKRHGADKQIKLLASCTYIYPSGYKVRMKKQTGGGAWHLYGTTAEGTLCHKPCTVSGGGKSEISKSIVNSMIQGPIFTADFHKDLEQVDAILRRQFGDQFRQDDRPEAAVRLILSPDRSLGSVIKLLTPSPEYTEAYNTWLQTIPPYIKEIVFLVKRHYKPEWGENWREHFSVDRINGHLGHELKYQNHKLIANYLRVGLEKDGAWRVFRVRHDFSAADKVQVEDDITASTVVPRGQLAHLPESGNYPSVKMVQNCENRLFQRPDDAIHRGYDKQAEADIAGSESFLSNFEPLTKADAKNILEDAIGFENYTDPMKRLIEDFLSGEKPDYVVSSAHPRIVNGKPSKNPRYLQNRPDLVNLRQKYLAAIGARLLRKIPLDLPVHFPVDAVLCGRRGSPPEVKAGVPMLAVYNPIHYQELPELFMDWISSMTGKSPSTTGFGSEGALTKGPFNALWPIVDLNNAFVSMALSGYPGFSTAAGYIGPKIRVDHDISLLVPEIWCRMPVEERSPDYLISNGFLEKMADYDFKGRTIPASLLGYRITSRFAQYFLGRIFSSPTEVFSEEMLKPELQNAEMFASGIESIWVTMQTAAQHYFDDGSVEFACPPLKALLHIMAKGHYNGKRLQDPEIRALFSRDNVVKSDWYAARLACKRDRDAALWERHVRSLKCADGSAQARSLLSKAEETLARVKSPAYLQALEGSLGAEPALFKGQPAPSALVRETSPLVKN